jgi:Uma2 family endonuclease
MATVLPQKYLIDVYQWQKLNDAAFFSPTNPRTELINGEILEMPPIGFNHAGHVTRLINFFAPLLKRKAIMTAQNPLRLGDFSEPQPDFMLLRPDESFYTSHHPEPTDVLLLVEVADSSLNYDREQKARLYALYGIAEYWLVNLNNESIEVYRHPTSDNYEQKSTLHYGETICLSQLPEISVNTADILSQGGL